MYQIEEAKTLFNELAQGRDYIVAKDLKYLLKSKRGLHVARHPRLKAEVRLIIPPLYHKSPSD